MPLNEMEEAGIRFESELAITFSIFGVWGLQMPVGYRRVNNWCDLKQGEGGLG